MIDDEEHQYDSAEPAGHDVQKTQVKGVGLSLAARHRLAFNADKKRLGTVVAVKATAYKQLVVAALCG